MNKNANSADVRCLTTAIRKTGQSLAMSLKIRMLLQKRFKLIVVSAAATTIVPYKVSYMKATSCLFMGVFCGSKNRP